MSSELAPGFLVAAPSLLDPNFKRSVVLLVDHRAEGSLGFVINRPANLKLSGMLDALSLTGKVDRAPDAPVLVGGPVAPDTGWLVFERLTASPDGEDVVTVSDDLAVSASRELLQRVVQEDGVVGRFALVLGYAGWGPGQLDEEIAQGAWIPVDLDKRIVFDAHFDARWTEALRSLGIEPGRLTAVVPSES
jgi:putative transcriptional regulator